MYEDRGEGFQTTGPTASSSVLALAPINLPQLHRHASQTSWIASTIICQQT